MRAVLIRHGRTCGNGHGRYNGRTDEPLSPEGAALAAEKGTDPDLERVYVSPMLRARQTARILFPNALQIPVEDLREMDFGAFEGKNAQELAYDRDYRAWVEGGCTAPCPGGEGLESFSLRVRAAFVQAAVQASEHGGPLVVVAHGGTIMAVMSGFARPRKRYFDYDVGNCQGYMCRMDWDRAGLPVLEECRPWEMETWRCT